mmetsp:Transcript_30635/g.76182  ORF Transcript_30635/g.76182 Transcript_30635/m.76182 type:complete len:109 (+) Transcript_30635:246-572(+)
MVSNGVWAGWVNKEFTTTMKSKGKMEVTKTIALDKRNEAFNGVKRIFVSEDLPIKETKPQRKSNPERQVLKSKLKALNNELEEESLRRRELEAQLAAMQPTAPPAADE